MRALLDHRYQESIQRDIDAMMVRKNRDRDNIHRRYELEGQRINNDTGLSAKDRIKELEAASKRMLTAIERLNKEYEKRADRIRNPQRDRDDGR